MIEAVVRLEWLLRFRRDQFRPLLSCYFACLVLDCCVLYYGVIADIFLPPSPSRSSQLLATAVEFLWIQQWLLPLLLAPPFVANAFAAEKANKLLPSLLITSLTSGEIVLGKFIARTAPLMLLGLAHLPFWGLLAGFAGFDAGSSCILAAVSLLPIPAASAVSLLASVWCRKTADAVVGAYSLFGIFILGSWAVDAAVTSFYPGCAWLAALQRFLQPFGPNYLLEPLWQGRSLLETGSRAVIAIAAWGSAVIACLALACWRLAPATMTRPEVRRIRLPSRRRSVGENPIAWKERYRERRMPLALLRNIPTWLALPAVFVATACLVLWTLCPTGTGFAELIECLWAGDWHTLGSRLAAGTRPARPAPALLLTFGMLLLGTLMVGVRSATAVSDEREYHTWDLLLLTPLSTQEIVRGKARGIMHSTLPYVAVYALAAVPLAWLAGSAELLMITVIGVFISAPIFWLAGAAGINQSARCDNSWQSILATVRLIIGGTFLTAFVSNFAAGFLGLIMLGLGILRSRLGLPLLLLVLVSFWSLVWWQASREYLMKAEKWIDDLERTREAEIESARRL